MSFVLEAVVVVAVTAGLVASVRRNLRHRPKARKLRNLYVSIADDLVGKPEFPDAHARLLAEVSAIPEGWLTRAMVFILLKEMIFGKGKKSPPRFRLDDVPPELQVKFATAVLALVLSDSYRCAVLGRLWRGANLWVIDAVKEPRPDANAHSTRRVVEQVGHVRAPRHVRAVEARLEHCPVA